MRILSLMLFAVPALVQAQAALAAQAAPAAHTKLSNEHAIIAATLPLPADMRADATVLGVGADGLSTTVLRTGTNGMTCLTPNPTLSDFHVACYQDSMEPFMARGRDLRKSGVKGAQVDTVRFAESKSGALALPTLPAALYSLSGGVFDTGAGKVTGARALYVVYIPYASMKTTGIGEKPAGNAPWIMFPGTPKAHIMFTPTM